jgi:nitroimidazol reductase NimA-like FMN-containing flavoprotein (pyridoxamine 5'-phosphate oxidase superfamily)
MERYHLRRADREITGEEDLRQILVAGKYAIIAMARKDEPYIVTLSYGYDEPRACLYFHCALKGQKLDFLRDNKKVCATIIADGGYLPGSCEHLFSSLVIRGEMEAVAELGEKKHGLEVLLGHLEKDPDPIRARNIKDDTSYDKVSILRLRIGDITGKSNETKESPGT